MEFETSLLRHTRHRVLIRSSLVLWQSSLIEIVKYSLCSLSRTLPLRRSACCWYNPHWKTAKIRFRQTRFWVRQTSAHVFDKYKWVPAQMRGNQTFYFWQKLLRRCTHSRPTENFQVFLLRFQWKIPGQDTQRFEKAAVCLAFSSTVPANNSDLRTNIFL